MPTRIPGHVPERRDFFGKVGTRGDDSGAFPTRTRLDIDYYLNQHSRRVRLIPMKTVVLRFGAFAAAPHGIRLHTEIRLITVAEADLARALQLLK